MFDKKGKPLFPPTLPNLRQGILGPYVEPPKLERQKIEKNKYSNYIPPHPRNERQKNERSKGVNGGNSRVEKGEEV